MPLLVLAISISISHPHNIAEMTQASGLFTGLMLLFHELLDIFSVLVYYVSNTLIQERFL